MLVPAAWYLPRVLLAAVLGLATVPLAWRGGHLAAALPEAYDRRSFGLVVTAVAFAGTFIAWFFPIPGKQFSPLQPVLRDNFWLTIHVLTIVSSYAAGALAWGLGCLSLGYYLLGRYAGWIGNFGLAAGSVIGAAVIGMSWYGVNFLLGAGLHSYGFGQGGQTEFFAFLLLNFALLAAAAWRWRRETGGAA
jgi:hypothetical protein